MVVVLASGQDPHRLTLVAGLLQQLLRHGRVLVQEQLLTSVGIPCGVLRHQRTIGVVELLGDERRTLQGLRVHGCQHRLTHGHIRHQALSLVEDGSVEALLP